MKKCLLLLLVLLAGCAAREHSPTGREVELDTTTFSFDAGTYPSSLNLFPEYRLVPGDVLDVLFQIRTWQEKKEFRLAVDHTVKIHFLHAPELDETQMIMPDGKISLPYVGEVYVVGRTVEELTSLLKEKYSPILRDTEMYVTVPEFRSSIKEIKNDLHTAPRGLSRLVTIRPDGYVTFPLTGDLFVAGRTIPDVNTALNELYEKLLPGLHCDLFLEKHSGSMLYVMGEVASPGSYQIPGPVSVAHAVALAKGHTKQAATDRIIVFRQHEKKVVGRAVNLADTLSLRENAEFLLLKPDDLVFVPKRDMSSLGDVMEDVMRVLMFRGWNIGLDGPLYENPLIKNN
ncbi:MAG: polysaccharide biosynthesis/export family protein [Thermodesulfobacteriota bacterium]